MKKIRLEKVKALVFHETVRMKALTTGVVLSILLMFGSYWLLNNRDSSQNTRLDSLEAGLTALAIAIDELKEEQPGAPIDTPEQIIEDAGEDPEDLLSRRGEQGPPGVAGPPGPEGPEGLPGVAGSDGSSGSIGSAGPPGSNGADGATGANGSIGPSGSTGASGPPGSSGPSGSTGPAGPEGPAGPAGQAPSPEQIEASILAYCDMYGCVGPQGPAGADAVPLTGEQIAQLLCDAGHQSMCK